MGVFDAAADGTLSRVARIYDATGAGVLSEVGLAYEVNAGGSLSRIFPIPPAVTSISPTSGYTTGGYVVNVYGSGFLNAQSVNVSGVTVAVTVVSDANVRFTMPAVSAGTKTIAVVTRGGTSNAANFAASAPTQTIALGSFARHPSSARAPSITASYVYTQGDPNATNSVAYQYVARGSWTYLVVSGYASALSGNGLFRIGIRSDPWPWSGTTYAETQGSTTWYIAGYSAFYIVVWGWGSSGTGAGYLTGAYMKN